MRKLIWLVLVCNLPVHTQSLSDYLGGYVFPKGFKEVPRFYQLDLIKDQADSIYGRVIFASDPRVTARDSMLYCFTNEIAFRGDSLWFETFDCLNERYRFAGRFLRKPEIFDENYLSPVLEGTLFHYNNERLLNQKKVAFLYDSGG